MLRGLILLLAVFSILSGCASSKGRNQNNLFNQAQVVRDNAEATKAEAREIMAKTEVIYNQVQVNDNAIREVLDSQATVGAPVVSERLGEALMANTAILEARSDISASAHAVDKLAGSTYQAANEVTSSARRVEDVPSFWDRLSTTIRRLILLALGLVVIVIGWRFGLDKLIKSGLNVVSTGINKMSEWAYSKYVGPAKLIREGKTNEAIAALRATIPGLDKSFRSTSSGSSGDAG